MPEKFWKSAALLAVLWVALFGGAPSFAHPKDDCVCSLQRNDIGVIHEVSGTVLVQRAHGYKQVKREHFLTVHSKMIVGERSSAHLRIGKKCHVKIHRNLIVKFDRKGAKWCVSRTKLVNGLPDPGHVEPVISANTGLPGVSATPPVQTYSMTTTFAELIGAGTIGTGNGGLLTLGSATILGFLRSDPDDEDLNFGHGEKAISN